QTYGRLDEAYDILKPYLADIDHSPDLEIQYVSILLAKKKSDDVYELLSKQFKENNLPPLLTQTLIDEAVKRKKIDFVEDVIKTADLKIISEDALMQYADLAYRLKRPGIAELLRSHLDKDFLQQAALLVPMLNVIENSSRQNIKILAGIRDDKIVTMNEKT